jgi:hypothetical protein
MALTIGNVKKGDLTLDATDVILAATPVEVSAGATLKATTITPFTDVAGLAAKVTGAGTVALTVDPFTIPAAGAPVFEPRIEITGAVTALGNATFTRGLTATGAVTNTGAGGPVTLTLGGSSTLASLTSAVATQPLTLAGEGGVEVTGAVTATGNLVVNNTGNVHFQHADNTIADTKTLVVGPGAKIYASSQSAVASAKLIFGEGTYTAGGTGGFKYGNDRLVSNSDNSGILKLGDSGTATNYLTLGGATAATNTFTANTGIVALSGKGNGAIIVSPTGDLALGATAELDLGDGTVAMGSGGKLTLVNGSKISGFTHADGSLATSAQTGDTFKGTGDFSGYSSGIGFPVSGAGYASNAITATGSYELSGASSNGGVLTKASDIVP